MIHSFRLGLGNSIVNYINLNNRNCRVSYRQYDYIVDNIRGVWNIEHIVNYNSKIEFMFYNFHESESDEYIVTIKLHLGCEYDIKTFYVKRINILHFIYKYIRIFEMYKQNTFYRFQ